MEGGVVARVSGEPDLEDSEDDEVWECIWKAERFSMLESKKRDVGCQQRNGANL